MADSSAAERVIVADADALAQEAARRILEAAKQSVSARGRFTIALAGGSTPEKAYGLLAAQSPLHDTFPWDNTAFFWGDERFVPRDDDRSNFRLAERALLQHLTLRPEQIHAIPTTFSTVEESARAYETELREAFASDSANGVPVFDLILLGLGNDGHTASLFPDLPSLNEETALVIASPPGPLPPPVDRITLTFPALNAARAVLFLISGSKKAEAVRRLCDPAAAVSETPAAGVRPTRGTLTYLLDKDAASRL